MSLRRFVEGHYLPFIELHNRISTYREYRNLWKRYLEPFGDIALRDFKTPDGERILWDVAKAHDLTSTTLGHIKALLSGIFGMRSGKGYSTQRIR